MTTEPRKRAARSSKALIRAWAWIGAALSFFTPAAAFALHATAAPVNAETAQRDPDIIVRRVVRRLVIEAPSTAAPRVVYVDSPTSTAPSSVLTTSSAVGAPIATTRGS
jgi:hypothetical protein